MQSQRAVHLIDRPDAPQSTLRVGLPAVDPTDDDYMALVVTNAILVSSAPYRVPRTVNVSSSSLCPSRAKPARAPASCRLSQPSNRRLAADGSAVPSSANWSPG